MLLLQRSFSGLQIIKLPIPKISPEQQQLFIDLVDKILASKACTPKAAGVQASIACAELEREINEIKIIEAEK